MGVEVMDIVMGIWIGLVLAIAAFAALMAILSFANKNPTTESNVADDRWFAITKWMDDDKKWSDSVGETIDEMSDTLDALYGWMERVSGQMEKIEGFCNLDAYNKTFVTVPANAKTKQGPDGLVWFDAQPEEPGYYWFIGKATYEGEERDEPMSIYVKYEMNADLQTDTTGNWLNDVMDRASQRATFAGWWAKMDVPEFKGGDK